MKVVLKSIKKYLKKNGVIVQENTLNLNNLYYLNTNYEDIESVYLNIKGTYFICPKGKYHVHFYNKNNHTTGILSVNLIDDSDWDLKCYYQYQEKMLFIGYLNSQNHFYEYDFDNEVFQHNSNINNGLYAFSWRTETWDNNQKQMFAIVKEGNKFYLKDLRITVKTGEDFGYNEGQNKIFLTNLKSNYLSMFKSNNLGFYYITYNDQFDFDSGYYNGDIGELTVNNFNSITINKNENKSPFKFVDKITIKEMKFIYDSRFAYYKIYNEDKEKIYYGIFDVSINSIIFNTDKEIKQFRPYNHNSMLVITDDSAYKICAIQQDVFVDHFNCVDECGDNIKMNANFGNNCNRLCFWEWLYTLMPENICYGECDKQYHIFKEKSGERGECWLCKDLDIKKPYKLIDREECLSTEPENSEYINKNLYIIKCKTGYDYLENGNCVEKCSEGFFLKNKDCLECNASCKECDKNENNCIKCNEDEYLNINSSSHNTCNKCSEKCETCSDGQKENIDNCLTCKKNSTYEFLYNKNCIEKCPENTFPNENNECIFKKKDDKEKKENKEETKAKDKVMLSIFIIVTGLMLIFVIFLFYKNFCYKFKEKNLIEEIQSELIENKEMS